MDFSQEKKQTERKNDTAQFLASEATPKSRIMVGFGIRSPISIFVTSTFTDAAAAKIFLTSTSLMLTSSNDAVIFGCTPRVHFHNLVPT